MSMISSSSLFGQENPLTVNKQVLNLMFNISIKIPIEHKNQVEQQFLPTKN